MSKTDAPIIILHDIRSAHNVGSIFRTAEAAGVIKVYLTGYTPTPIDRFERKRNDIAKTALGAEENLEWEHVQNPEAAFGKVREAGYTVVGLEQDKKARDYRTFTSEKPVALVFGNEVDGISHELRSLCDALIEIPLYGKKESLNVSVAAGVALFALKS